MKKEYKQFGMPLTDQVVKDACTMGSVNFTDIYEEAGYDPLKLGQMWYNARRSHKGQKLLTEIHNKYPSMKKDPNRVLVVKVTKADQKASADALGQEVEASPVKGIRASTNPKMAEARKHFENGVTRKQDLAAAMGISEGYCYKLLRVLKNEQ